MANLSDIFLIILLILSICINCCSVAAVIWLLSTIPGQWTTWILCFYSLFFSFVQLFIEIFCKNSGLVFMVFSQ